MLNRKTIKADARQLLGTARVSPFVMTAIVILIVFLLDRVSDLVEYGRSEERRVGTECRL